MMLDTLGRAGGRPRAGDRLDRPSASCSSTRTASAPTASPACLAGLGHRALAGLRHGRSGFRRRAAGADRRAGGQRLAARTSRFLDVRRRLGRCAARTCALRVAGRSSTPTRIYPDVDDTAVVGMLLHRQGDPGPRRGDRPRAQPGSSACRAATAAGAPSTPDNTHAYLNHIPFADHGALLDPSNRRCHRPLRRSFLAQLGHAGESPTRCSQTA